MARHTTFLRPPDADAPTADPQALLATARRLWAAYRQTRDPALLPHRRARRAHSRHAGRGPSASSRPRWPKGDRRWGAAPMEPWTPVRGSHEPPAFVAQIFR